MNWNAVAAVANLLAALGVIGTVAYLAVQVRQNSKLLASSLSESIRDGLNEATRILASDREAARVFWVGIEDRSSLSEQERRQFDAILMLNFYGQQQAFVNSQVYDPASLKWILTFPGTRDWWAAYSQTLSEVFRAYVDRMLKGQSPIR